MSKIGIDLGTYNSVAAFVTPESGLHVLRSRYGRTKQGYVFPSFVKFDLAGNVELDARGNRLIGEPARQLIADAPKQVVWGVKRLIGQAWREVQEERKRFLYPLEEAPDGTVRIPIGKQPYTPSDITRILLEKIKEDVENAAINPQLSGRSVEKVVITHPAYFNALQIQQTRQAAEKAGFAEIELITEPEAAALVYGTGLDQSKPQFVMVIDWGAGTLDIVIVELTLDEDGFPMMAGAAPAYGQTHLGGLDMDNALADAAIDCYHLDDLKELHQRLRQGENVTDNPSWEPLLKDLGDVSLQVEAAKIELSEKPYIPPMPSLYKSKGFDIKVVRTKDDKNRYAPGEADWLILEEILAKPRTSNPASLVIVKEFLEMLHESDLNSLGTLKKVLEEARKLDPKWLGILDEFVLHILFALVQIGFTPRDIKHVLLVGGPMYMPCVRSRIAKVFSGNPQVLSELKKIDEEGFPLNPMEGVAQGAAYYAVRGEAPVERRTQIKVGHRPIPPFDYGLALLNPMGIWQGEKVIVAGGGLPQPKDKKPIGPLEAPGQPGDGIPVSLYLREERPQGARYLRMGDYQFYPAFDANGMATFIACLQMNPEGICSLFLSDLRTKQSLQLDNLDKVQAEEILEPMPFGIGSGPGPGPGGPVVPVPQEQVEKAKRRASGHLQIARAKLSDRQDTELLRLCNELEAALRSLPVGNSPPHLYQAVQNGCEKLRNHLDSKYPLTEAERALLG